MPSADQVLIQLPELSPDSKKRISNTIINDIVRSPTKDRWELIRTKSNPNGPGDVNEPTRGWDSVANHVHTNRNLMTLSLATEDDFTRRLNLELEGGEAHPILDAVLGTAAGAASAGAGLIFTIATTALDASRTSSQVLGRGGDQIWCVEEIGKRNGAAYHVGAFFLIDPFRNTRNSPLNGWLLHEHRTLLNLPVES